MRFPGVPAAHSVHAGVSVGIAMRNARKPQSQRILSDAASERILHDVPFGIKALKAIGDKEALKEVRRALDRKGKKPGVVRAQNNRTPADEAKYDTDPEVIKLHCNDSSSDVHGNSPPITA